MDQSSPAPSEAQGVTSDAAPDAAPVAASIESKPLSERIAESLARHEQTSAATESAPEEPKEPEAEAEKLAAEPSKEAEADASPEPAAEPEKPAIPLTDSRAWDEIEFYAMVDNGGTEVYGRAKEARVAVEDAYRAAVREEPDLADVTQAEGAAAIAGNPELQSLVADAVIRHEAGDRDALRDIIRQVGVAARGARSPERSAKHTAARPSSKAPAAPVAAAKPAARQPAAAASAGSSSSETLQHRIAVSLAKHSAGRR